MSEKIKRLTAFLEIRGIDKKKLIILGVALVGIILIVISSFNTEDSAAEIQTTVPPAAFSESEYTQQLEKKLEEMVSSLSGAGRSKVVVTLECDYETVYAKDGSYSKDDSSSDEESAYIIIGGEEREGGLVLKTVTPKVRGVAVLCEGGGDPAIEIAVCEMLSALLNIGANNISVSKIQ